MRQMFLRGGDGWRIGRRQGPPDRELEFVLRDRLAVAQWLRRLTRDAFTRAELQPLLSAALLPQEAARLNADEIVDRLARDLASGFLIAVRTTPGFLNRPTPFDFLEPLGGIAQAPAPESSKSAWTEFGGGVYDTTVGPIVEAVSHPVDTVIGIGTAIANPVETASAIKDSVVETAKGVMAGDPRALGELAGTIASTALTAGAAKGASAIATKGKLLAAARRVKPGTRVIGHFPEYVNLAKQTGAKHFSVPDRIWRSMSKDQQWAANKKFLDRAIRDDATFVLSNGRDEIRRGTALRKEVDYLLEKGYKWSEDGSRLERSLK